MHAAHLPRGDARDLGNDRVRDRGRAKLGAQLLVAAPRHRPRGGLGRLAGRSRSVGRAGGLGFAHHCLLRWSRRSRSAGAFVTALDLDNESEQVEPNLPEVEDHAIFNPVSCSSRGCRSSSGYPKTRPFAQTELSTVVACSPGERVVRPRTPAHAGRCLCRPEGRPRNARSDFLPRSARDSACPPVIRRSH